MMKLLPKNPPTRVLILTLTLLPIIITGIYLLIFGINLPFRDQWEVVSLLIRKQQGALSLGDLFAQHNEHRPFFPRLIWLGLAGMTRYNVNFELWVNLCLSVGTFSFFVQRSVRTWKKFEISIPPFLVPLISLLVFNLGQFESWLQGFQTVMFLGTACIVIGLFLLAEGSNWVSFLVALLLGVVANYSMANGMLYWFIGLAVIWVSAPKSTRMLKAAVWVLVSTLSIGLFFRDWAPISKIDFGYLLTHLPEWIVWELNFLGAPIITYRYVAWVYGLLSLVLYGLILRNVIQTRRWKPLVPYFAITCFVLITAVSISLGRISLGIMQSTSSRYPTMSVWYWVSLLTLFPLLNTPKLSRKLLYGFLTSSLILQMLAGGWRGYVNIYQLLLPVQQAVLSGQTVTNEQLTPIYPIPEIVRERLEFLCQNKLSVCADIPATMIPKP